MGWGVEWQSEVVLSFWWLWCTKLSKTKLYYFHGKSYRENEIERRGKKN